MNTYVIGFALSNVREAMELLDENEYDISKIRNQLLSAEQHLLVLENMVDFSE